MASTGSKILIGCGIGCLAMIIVIVAIGFTGFSLVRNIVQQFEDMEVAMDEVHDRYGRATDFTPAPGGVIAPERMEAFLAVRDDMGDIRRKLEHSVELISRVESGDEPDNPIEVFKLAKAGVRLLPQFVEFYNVRNAAMLDEDIGPGEYLYIYSIAYLSWLRKSPGDGPSFQIMGGSNYDDVMDEFEIREMRLEDMYERIQDFMLPMLRNQLAELDQDSADRETRAWFEMLTAEIDELDGDPFHIPWQSGLPREIEYSLEPYRERLEGSYSEMCAALELGPLD